MTQITYQVDIFVKLWQQQKNINKFNKQCIAYRKKQCRNVGYNSFDGSEFDYDLDDDNDNWFNWWLQVNEEEDNNFEDYYWVMLRKVGKGHILEQ